MINESQLFIVIIPCVLQQAYKIKYRQQALIRVQNLFLGL